VLVSRGASFNITQQLTAEMASTLAQWIGVFGVIWNSKVAENRDSYKSFLAGACPKPKPNQKVSHFCKDPQKPWLKEVPSQIRRNAASQWMTAMNAFFKGVRGLPKFKKSVGMRSVLVTKELFQAERKGDEIQISLKKTEKSLPFVSLTLPLKGKLVTDLPKQLWVKRQGAKFFLSFSYEEKIGAVDQDTLLKRFVMTPEDKQDAMVLGIDLGVVQPITLSNGDSLGFTPQEQESLQRNEIRKQKYQKLISKRQVLAKKRKLKTGKNYKKIQAKHSKKSAKIANIRGNMAHRISKEVVQKADVLVMEKLNVKNMTKASQKKEDPKTKKLQRKNVKAKAGLNRSILGVGFAQIKNFIQYKSEASSVYLAFIDPKNTSRECSRCGYIHADNRKSQASFLCQSCGHQDNADINAAKVLKNRFLTSVRTGKFSVKKKPSQKITFRKKPPEQRFQPVEPMSDLHSV